MTFKDGSGDNLIIEKIHKDISANNLIAIQETIPEIDVDTRPNNISKTTAM